MKTKPQPIARGPKATVAMLGTYGISEKEAAALIDDAKNDGGVIYCTWDEDGTEVSLSIDANGNLTVGE